MTERDDVDGLLAEARAVRPEPSDALLARIMADADAVARERAAPVARPAAPASVLAALARALGGWPALGGLLASASLGLVLGVAQPAGLPSLPASIWGEEVSVAIGADEEDPLGFLEG